MITRHDKILLCATIAVALILMVILNFCVYSGKPSSVLIEVDGRTYAEYALTDIKDERIVEVKTEYGSNKILISSSGVKVTEASCEDKLDVLSKPITKPNQMLVCVPNRLVVRITGDAADLGVDRVAY